jgi:NitT/TauT family transport system substrate-binding protein
VTKRAARFPMLAAASVLGLALSACGGGDSTAAAGDGGCAEMTTINVGTLPITSSAAFLLGVDKGFFEEEKLAVETEFAQSGAALVPAVLSGQYQFGFSNNLSLLLAHSRGLPVRIVRSANSADSDPAPSQEALVVSNESGITGLEQLEGKTIAVNSLNNSPHISVLVTLKEAGVDTSKVKFVELGFPDMPLAVQEGRVDAADISEPFLREALENGGVDLAHPYRVVEQDQHLSSWFTIQPYIGQNQCVVDAFARAVDKSNSYAREHTDEVREFVPSYLEVDPETAQAMAMPRYPEGTPKIESLQQLADYAAEFGFVQSAPDGIDQVIADAG